jgi:folylpolyglutamate synthase/dihydrofolate synthase
MRFVHIAGTNGKGSVSEYIYRILRAAGKRTGCFTSPHLVLPTERIRLNGRDIPMAEYGAAMAEAAERKLAVNDTLFAQQTAAALLWFRRNGAEYAVIETGIGGRMDATNVLTPQVSVLTSIGIDHTDILGGTIEQIAYDKCGIIKPGVPVVSAPQHKIVADMIADTCARLGCALRFAEGVQVTGASLQGQAFEFEGNQYAIRMIGAGQPVNAAAAILAAQGLGLPQSAITQGLKETMVPCRTQFIPGTPDMLLDGAHNAPATDMLLQTLDRHFAGREVTLLFACMRNKDYSGMAQRLGPRCRKAFVTNVDAVRGMDTAALRKLFAAYADCAAEDDAARAYDLAREHARERGALLLVCGSLYLAGYVWGSLQYRADYFPR